MTPQETARRILALYDGKPERWTQGCYARDADGREVTGARNVGVCWCVFGAADLVSSAEDGDAFIKYASDKIEQWVPNWNDAEERSFADVVALLEKIAAEPTP